MKLRPWHGLVWALLVAAALGDTAPARAQTVVDIYQRQRFRKLALELIGRTGERVGPYPPMSVPTSADSLLNLAKSPPVIQPERVDPPVTTIRFWQRIPKLARGHFERRFEGEDWVFLGTDRLSPLDTMMTREIRGRLEAHFGKPTRTLADEDAVASAATGEIFQFEYWFILEDEIPLIVTDVNGPFERGVATSTLERFGDRLRELRDVFMSPVIESDRKAPFVDYYYEDEALQWYRTGYDSREFFLEQIQRPGRNRPVLRRDPE